MNKRNETDKTLINIFKILIYINKYINRYDKTKLSKVIGFSLNECIKKSIIFDVEIFKN